MKKYLLGGLLLAPGLALAQLPQPFTVKGQVNSHVDAPAKAYLFRGDAFTDSVAVKNGQFAFTGTVAAPSKAYVLLSRRGKAADSKDIMHADFKAGFYLEPGTTTLTSPDSLKYAQVAGGKLTTEWQALTTAMQPVSQQFKQYYAEYDAATPAQRQAPAFKQARAVRKALIHRELLRIDSAFVAAHPASLVSADEIGLLSNTKADSATARRLVALLAPPLRANQGQQILTKIARMQAAPLVGMPAPDFTLPAPDGQPVALRSYRGKYVLVDFWASWCGPCRAENPNVARVYNEYKNRHFDVLGVSIDVPDARAKWLQAVRDDRLPWTQVLDLGSGAGRAAALYQVQAIPQNFLIDPSGKIVALNLRGEALRTTLAQLIK